MQRSVVVAVRKRNRGLGWEVSRFASGPVIVNAFTSTLEPSYRRTSAMRLNALTTLLALVAGACGGGSKSNTSQAAAAGPRGPDAPPPPAAPPAPARAWGGGKTARTRH